MGERAASSTAVLVCQGRAVADGRYAPGRFSDPVARRLLDPAERAVVDAVRAGHVPAAGGDRLVHELVRRTGEVMVPRALAIDAQIRDHAAEQVVLLGAGLDARAWRMPELAAATVFEVDHPASSRDKQRRVEAAAGLEPVARRVIPVAVDLALEPLGPALTAAGFEPSAGTTWVWEGVVPYLTPAAAAATLHQVAQLSAGGDRLVVNYRTASVTASVLRRVMRLVMRATGAADPLAGEPWRSRWRPAAIAALLVSNGFTVRTDDDLLTLATGLGLPPGAAGSLRNGRVAAATRG